MDENIIQIIQSEYNGCWWPVDVTKQGMNSPAIDLVFSQDRKKFL